MKFSASFPGRLAEPAKPATEILGSLAISMKQYPNIAPGQDFDGNK